MENAPKPTAVDPAQARRFAEIVAHLPHGVVTLDRRGRVVDANPAALRLLGVAEGAAAGSPVEDLFAGPSRATLAAALASPDASGPHLVHAAAGPLDVIVSATRAGELVVRQLHLDDASARLVAETELAHRARALAFLRDLAETVAGEPNAERALGRALALIERALAVRGAAIARYDAERGAVALVAQTGLDDAVVAQCLAAMPAALRALDPSAATVDVPAPVRAALARVGGGGGGGGGGSEGGGEVLALPLRHADWLAGVAVFALDAPSAAVHALLLAGARTIAVALHASVEYDAAVRLAAERRQLLDSIQTLVFRIDAATGATLYINAAVERVLGVSVAQAAGTPGLAGLLVDDAERESLAAAQAHAHAEGAGASPWVDRRFAHRDGRTRVLRTRLYRVAEPRVTAPQRAVIEGIAQDVTDEIEARKQLVHADRLASLGTLAAGVAHEINNPAAFISLGVQQLARTVAQMPDDDATARARGRMREVIDELADGIKRIVQIVGELKLFARIPEGSFSTPVDVNRLIVSAVTLVRAELRHRARLETDLGELPPLPGDHARLGQVFVNLLINAAQAIPPGDEEHNLVRVVTRAVDRTVVVEVRDTGVGIAPEHLARIFDPFFTTKAPGEGTGLGLAISYDLVRRAGGAIDVVSELGRGTRFIVQLPVREFVPAGGERHQPVPAAAENAKVLVVDDEQHLALAIARALAASYLVELAPDARTALARIEAGDGREYDAVLCDLRLPGMDGRALYEAVQARWPEQAARFVFLTGARLTGEFARFVAHTDRPLLEKPFEMSDLESVIERIVATRPRTGR